MMTSRERKRELLQIVLSSAEDYAADEDTETALGLQEVAELLRADIDQTPSED